MMLDFFGEMASDLQRLENMANHAREEARLMMENGPGKDGMHAAPQGFTSNNSLRKFTGGYADVAVQYKNDPRHNGRGG